MSYAYVTVDYTFFNSGAEKTVLVGFEASSPGGDIGEWLPKDGSHPYIYDFKVVMNGENLKFKVSLVDSESYYVNNQIDAKSEEEIQEDEYSDFYYVYHFEANFKPGVNKIIHTYKFNMSHSVMNDYDFDYILTAANRWSNKQIDDFTLNIKMGEDESFNVSNTFFQDKDEWQIDDGRSVGRLFYDTTPVTNFVTHSGGITFQKKNFQPSGELYLFSGRGVESYCYDSFNYKMRDLPNKIVYGATCTESVNEQSFVILRNLPFAIRGYVFRNKLIQNYYLSQSWYKPNPEYEVDLDALSEHEREWLKAVKQNEWTR